MIEDLQPRYKINYLECKKDKLHEGQSLNFVCLHEQCRDDSLICSMCRNGKHKSHPTCPLKFYLEQLKKDYQLNTRDFNLELQSLQYNRSKFFYKLKQTVEKVAEQFQKLQHEVMEKFNIIHRQILQQQKRKQKFHQFYTSLSNETGESTESLIYDYLPRKQTKVPSNLAGLDKITTLVSKEILQFSAELMEEQQQGLNYQQSIIVPKNITLKNNTYTQTNHVNNAESLGILDLNLLKDLQNVKIKIKVKRLKKATVTMGAMTKDLYNSLNLKAPGSWNSANHNGKLFYCNNNGVVFGQTKSQWKTYSEGSSIEVMITEENKMKICMRKNSAEYILPAESHFCFFFCLQGNAELQMNFLKLK